MAAAALNDHAVDDVVSELPRSPPQQRQSSRCSRRPPGSLSRLGLSVRRLDSVLDLDVTAVVQQHLGEDDSNGALRPSDARNVAKRRRLTTKEQQHSHDHSTVVASTPSFTSSSSGPSTHRAELLAGLLQSVWVAEDPQPHANRVLALATEQLQLQPRNQQSAKEFCRSSTVSQASLIRTCAFAFNQAHRATVWWPQAPRASQWSTLAPGGRNSAGMVAPMIAPSLHGVGVHSSSLLQSLCTPPWRALLDCIGTFGVLEHSAGCGSPVLCTHVTDGQSALAFVMLVQVPFACCVLCAYI